jgi:hypothetical protein
MDSEGETSKGDLSGSQAEKMIAETIARRIDLFTKRINDKGFWIYDNMEIIYRNQIIS